jgi:hypothetical protein
MVYMASGSDITRLWMIGNRKLCFSLRYGVTHLKFELRFFRTENWPRIASEFINLTSLTLDCGGPSGVVREMIMKASDLLELSPKLQILDLQSSYAILPCSEAFGSPNGSFSNLDTLKFSYHMDADPIPINEVKFPRNLKTLDFRRSQFKTELPVSILPPNLEHLGGEFSYVGIQDENEMLPASLQSINVPTYLGAITAERPADFIRCIARSTPNLKSLTMTLLVLDEKVAKLLPLSLTSLSLKHSRTRPVDLKLFQLLPPSLTRIEGLATQSAIATPIAYGSDSANSSAFKSGNESFEPIFPRQFRVIAELWVQASAIPFLPQNLEVLSVKAIGRAINAYSAQIGQLPLVSLQLQSLVGLAFPLPPTLKHLTLLECSNIASTAHFLPPGLETLKTRKAGTLFSTPNDFRLLPKNLKILQCESNLTKLDLSNDSAALLPKGLIELTLPQTKNLSCEWISGLPHSLTEIALSTEILTADCLRGMPRTLQKLTIKELTDENNQNQWIPNLPRSLAYFDISFAQKNKEFLDRSTPIDHFQLLPPFLITLILPSLGVSLPPNYRSYLPRSLTVFFVNHSLIYLGKEE